MSKNSTERKLILALETGIDGGSVAILEGRKLLCAAEGTGSVSKSEDLLLLVEELLEKNGLGKNELGLIAVSDRPGSATGIRIGLATAIGLGNSLSVKVHKCPILKAQVIVAASENLTVSALYSEKNGIYYQKYRESDGIYFAETETLNEREWLVFKEFLEKQEIQFILDKKLGQKLLNDQDFNRSLNQNKIRIMQGNLAGSLGQSANFASDNKESK